MAGNADCYEFVAAQDGKIQTASLCSTCIGKSWCAVMRVRTRLLATLFGMACRGPGGVTLVVGTVSPDSLDEEYRKFGWMDRRFSEYHSVLPG